MKKELKGFVVGIILTTLLISNAAFAAGVRQKIDVVFNSVNLAVNGKPVKADNILYKGTTYVPLRAVSEMLGKEVSWDQKTNTAGINDKGAVLPPAQTSSYNRNNPAPTGIAQKVTVDTILEQYTAEVTVKEVIRGEKAWEMIKAANMFNKETGLDEEYVLVKINIKVSDVKDDKKVDVSPVNFKVYSKDNVEYKDTGSVVPPEPALRTSLYTDGEHEGYAVYKVKKSDADPKLVYGQKYDGTGGIWFKLK